MSCPSGKIRYRDLVAARLALATEILDIETLHAARSDIAAQESARTRP